MIDKETGDSLGGVSLNEEKIKEILGADVYITPNVHEFAEVVRQSVKQSRDNGEDVRHSTNPIELVSSIVRDRTEEGADAEEIRDVSRRTSNLLSSHVVDPMSRLEESSGMSSMTMQRATSSEYTVFSPLYGLLFDALEKGIEAIHKEVELYKAGVYGHFALSESRHIVLTHPSYIMRDGQLHSEMRPALEFGDESEYYLHGVKFGEKMWKKIVKKKVKPEEILAIENTEQKTVAMRVYGYDKIIKDMDAEVKETMEIEIKGQKKEYQLIDVDLKDDELPARFVKVVCHSTFKETMLRVPPTEETEKLKDALAWTAGLEAEEYEFEKET